MVLGCLLVSNVLFAQAEPNTGLPIELEFTSGIASGWWIYTLGTGAGIDRTDNVPKISFGTSVVYKPGRLGVGLGLGYSFLTDNTMEAFEDTRAQRRKYRIAENAVRFWEYYLVGEYDLFSNHKYRLTPQVRAGSFNINTTHPEKDNFGNRYLFELGVLNQIRLDKKLNFTVRPFYQVLKISIKQPSLSGEKHRIYSLGLSFGVRYRL